MQFEPKCAANWSNSVVVDGVTMDWWRYKRTRCESRPKPLFLFPVLHGLDNTFWFSILVCPLLLAKPTQDFSKPVQYLLSQLSVCTAVCQNNNMLPPHMSSLVFRPLTMSTVLGSSQEQQEHEFEKCWALFAVFTSSVHCGLLAALMLRLGLSNSKTQNYRLLWKGNLNIWVFW